MKKTIQHKANLEYLKNRQAQFSINNLPSIVISIFVVAVTLGLLATILSSFKTNFKAENSNILPNESLTWGGNNTAISLSQSNLAEGSEKFYSNGTLLNIGRNYTIDYAGGKITPLNESSFQWVTNQLNVSFTYKFGNYERNITGYGLTGTNTLASYVPTIALVLVAAIIIGLVFAMFMRKMR